MDPTAPDPGGIPPLLWFAVTVALLLWAVTRPRLVRQALRIVASQPAFLVPVAMLTVAMATFAGAGHYLSENPFDHRAVLFSSGFAWVGLALSSVAVAGLIGLLEAWDDQRKPDSEAFRTGIRRHVGTIFGAKLLMVGALSLVLGWAGHSSTLLIVCLVPSLVLAPVIGTTSLHPNRPWEALLAAFRTVRRQMWFIGRVVTAQAVLWIGLLLLLWYVIEGQVPDLGGKEFAADLAVVAPQLSPLGFNCFTLMAGWSSAPLLFTIAIAAMGFGSTVFLTAHWLGATGSYLPKRVETDAGRPRAEQKADDA